MIVNKLISKKLYIWRNYLIEFCTPCVLYKTFPQCGYSLQHGLQKWQDKEESSHFWRSLYTSWPKYGNLSLEHNILEQVLKQPFFSNTCTFFSLMPYISLVLMALPRFEKHSLFLIPNWKVAIALVLECYKVAFSINIQMFKEDNLWMFRSKEMWIITMYDKHYFV